MSRAALEERVTRFHRAERELDAKLLDLSDAHVSDDLVAAAVNGKSLDAAMSKLPNVDSTRTLVASICQCRSDRLAALQKLAHLAGDVHLEQSCIRDGDADALQRQVDAHLAEIEKLDGTRYQPMTMVPHVTELGGRKFNDLVAAPKSKIQQLRDEATALRRQAAEAERLPVLGSGSVVVELRNFQADPLAPEVWKQVEAALYADPMVLQPAAYEVRRRLDGEALRKQSRERGSTGNVDGPCELVIKWKDSRLTEVALTFAPSISMRSPAPLSPHQAALG